MIVAAVYTGFGLDDILRPLFSELLPNHKLINLVDDEIIHAVRCAGKPTPEVYRRLFAHFEAASLSGADLILNTCSSVGEVAENCAPFFSIPIIRIDLAMAKTAVVHHDRIGVIATLSTTLNPTVALLRREAHTLGKELEIMCGSAEGAYDALISGDRAGHDECILKQARSLAENCDALVLAQGSMARIEEALKSAVTIPVYTSPRLCFEQIKQMAHTLQAK